MRIHVVFGLLSGRIILHGLFLQVVTALELDLVQDFHLVLVLLAQGQLQRLELQGPHLVVDALSA
jgi:hypothetical protein